MSREKINGDEILYMDDVGDGVMQPLTIDSIESRIAPHSTAQVDVRPILDKPEPPDAGEIDDLESVDKPSFDIQPRIGENLLPASSEWALRSGTDISTVFPQPPIQTIPDVNVYQHKKTLAQGMMDLALLSANANQLRYVLQTDGNHPYYYPSLAMIGMSLFLQIAVGIGLIWNSQYNVKVDAQMYKAERANNFTVIGIFLVTILNVFISSFGVVDQITTTAVTT